MNKPQQPEQKSVFFNLGLFQFLSFVRRGIFYTFMINYLFDLMQTVTYTALLGTLNMAASALGQNLLWGKLSDRHQLRTKLLVAGESIAAFTYLIVFLIHKSLIDNQANFAAGLSLIIGLSTLEFFWSMSDVGWAALLADVTTDKTRGRIVGTLNFIASLGRMIGILFSGFLYGNGDGFKHGTIFYIVMTMLVGSATLMWITNKMVKKPKTETRHLTPTDTTKNSQKNNNEHIYRWFLLSLVIIIIGTACISQVFLLFLRLPEGLATDDPETSLILTAWTIGGMLTSLASGWLSDRIGRVKILLIGLILAIATPAFYGIAPNVPIMAFIYALNGVSFWTIQIVGFTLAGDIIPKEKRGRLFSRYNTVMALSWGPAGLLIGGPLADIQTKIAGIPAYNAYINTFYASSVIVLIGTILFAAKVAKAKPKTG
jgi:MFS family permease